MKVNLNSKFTFSHRLGPATITINSNVISGNEQLSDFTEIQVPQNLYCGINKGNITIIFNTLNFCGYETIFCKDIADNIKKIEWKINMRVKDGNIRLQKLVDFCNEENTLEDLQ